MAIDESQNVVTEMLCGYKVFDDFESYDEWCDDMQSGKDDDDRWLHYGDCSLSYRGAKDMGVYSGFWGDDDE